MVGFIAMLVLVGIFGVLAMVFAALWVYRDAVQRDIAPALWVVLVVVTGVVVGLVLYLLLGRKNSTKQAPAAGGRGLLAASVACIVLALAAVGFCLYFYFTTPALLALL